MANGQDHMILAIFLCHDSSFMLCELTISTLFWLSSDNLLQGMIYALISIIGIVFRFSVMSSISS